MIAFVQRAMAAMGLRTTPPALPAPTPAAPPSRRQYEGAKGSRLTSDWLAPSTGANTEIWGALLLLRNRARDLTRNNPHAARAVSAMCHNLVGNGILATCTHENEETRKKVNDLFVKWSAQMSVADDLDLAGVQTVAVRSWLESGDVLLRRRWRRPDDGLAVPVQVQVLESDFLNEQANSILPGGGRIVQGVEFDAIDRRAAYHLWRTHPGDFLQGQAVAAGVARVPAADVAHLYEPLRPGQVRGVSWLSPAIVAMRMLDQYDAAEQVRKRTEACLAAFIIPGDEVSFDADEDGIGTAAYDSDGNILERIEPGMIATLRNGKDIRFPAPGQNGGYPEYVRTQLRTIAAGLRMPYELLTGDLSQVNYSSYRAGWIDFRRQVQMLQRQLIIPLLCQPIWRWFIDAAIAGGQLPPDAYPVRWTPPRFEDIDRLKEAQAAAAEIRAGIRSQQDVITENGDDPDQVLAEQAAWLAQCDAAGISFDTDPRRPQSVGGGMPLDTAEKTAKLPAEE